MFESRDLGACFRGPALCFSVTSRCIAAVDHEDPTHGSAASPALRSPLFLGLLALEVILLAVLPRRTFLLPFFCLFGLAFRGLRRWWRGGRGWRVRCLVAALAVCLCQFCIPELFACL